MERDCPNCRVALSPRNFHGVTLDECAGCTGIWFDAGELKSLIQGDPRTLPGLDVDEVPHPEPHETTVARLCPACGATMQPYRYDHATPILVDSCSECWGVWIDRGELDKVQHWQSASPPSSEQARADAAITMAQFEIEHEREMQRLANIRTFANVLGSRHPYMWLLRW